MWLDFRKRPLNLGILGVVTNRRFLMARKIHELGFGQPANTAVSPRQVHTTYLKICSIIHTCIMISLDTCNSCLLVFSCNVKICFLKVKLALWLKCLEWSYFTRETGSNKLCQTASGKQKKTMELVHIMHNTIEPHVSDHTKCKDLVVAYKNRTTGGLFQEEVRVNLLYGR